jgi:signal transduction histidine kinase/CheY-like chemotaxis protein
VPDVTEDTRYVPVYEQTRSEMALPLTFGERVIGVLDVSSAQPNAFSEDDLQLFQTLAGTASAVIQNTRLLAEIRAANEQLRELDKLKSQFLANMSHELRTPLNSIIGFSRVILKGIDGPLTELQQQDLETIHSSGQHLLSLINDMLDQAKIEAGKMKIQPDYVDLGEIIQEAMTTATGLVKDKPVDLIADVPDDLPQVYGDQMRIRQVLLNLASNAAKFTYEGSITIRAVQLQADPATGEPSRVRVDVVDTGIGISPEDQAKLFEAFSQVDTSTTRRAGGTGLGLAISRQLIELHGGSMWVQSELGQGATFCFTVPLHPLAKRAEAPALQPTTAERSVVLAVDDDQSVLNLYQRYLDKQGYTVIGLTSGQNVVEYVRQYKPVAVMLDIMMPDKDGWQVMAELKSNPDTRRVPVIMCSIVEEQNKGFSLGAANYLVKPILEDDLVEALEHLNGEGGIRDVLVVDDEPEYLDQIRSTLELTGAYQVRQASSGAEALEAIHSQPPDLLILDMVMPDLDGLDILTQLRDDERTCNLPVLLLATDDLSDKERQRLTDQAVQLINKSACSGDELLVGITQTLSKLA